VTWPEFALVIAIAIAIAIAVDLGALKKRQP